MREYYSVQIIEVPELVGEEYRTIHLEFTGGVENDCMWVDPTIVMHTENNPSFTANISKEALGVLIGSEIVTELTTAARDEMIEEWAYGD